MSTDDEFVQHLRDRADAAAPAVTVDTARVLPRARRRRAATRAAGVGAVAVLAVTGVVVGQAWADAPWRSGAAELAPAGTGTTAPSAGPETGPAPGPTGTAQTTTGTAQTTTGTAQGAAPYWYTHVLWVGADGTREDRETWSSRDRPGLFISDGDLGTAGAMGPVDVLGRYRLGGQWVDMLRDPAALPTDGDALREVLRDSVEPDRGSGNEDDKVVAMATALIEKGGTLPTSLLLAARDAVAGVPGVVAVVQAPDDFSGRRYTVLEYTTSTGGAYRLVTDTSTGLLHEYTADGFSRYYTDTGPRDTVPVEPTLELAGCTAWESC
jgi:hypothetical protein